MMIILIPLIIIITKILTIEYLSIIYKVPFHRQNQKEKVV